MVLPVLLKLALQAGEEQVSPALPSVFSLFMSCG